MATVLAVDKDTFQLDLLAYVLGTRGHRVHVTPDPEVALDMLQSTVVELVILDTALPRQDGLRFCQQIRQINPYTPVMIVSERQDEEQIVRALEMAADDYIVKPFSARQLVARVHALLRRADLSRGGRWLDENLSIGEISLNLQQMHAVVNGVRVRLRRRELSLLHALMENSPRVLSREQLMQLVWGDDSVVTTKAVDQCVHGLRSRLQPQLSGGSYIQALRGFGYKFEMPRPQAVLQ